jgi:hypothetical protein
MIFNVFIGPGSKNSVADEAIDGWRKQKPGNLCN